MSTKTNTVKKIFITAMVLHICALCYSQVGINTTAPSTTLQVESKNPATKVEGLLIPRLTGDEIYNMPIATTTTNESNLVYAKSAASTANQVGRGANLKGKGFFYWDGTTWVTMVNSTTTNNYYSAHIKPMNILLNDTNTYPQGGNGILSPTSSTALKHFVCDYASTEVQQNNPLGTPPGSFVIWDNGANKINVPPQLLGHAITVNISLKYPANNSNAAITRFAAYTGNATITSGGLYGGGGTKLKDLYFKISKTSAFPYIRDELVLSPIIVTQDIIDYGIYLFLGESPVTYFEPVLTIDFGVVDDTL